MKWLVGYRGSRLCRDDILFFGSPLVDDTQGVEKYKHVQSTNWSEEEIQQGKIIKIKGFPKDKKVKLFRVIVSTDKTEYVVTNDLNQDSTDAVQQVCGNQSEN